MRLKRMLAGLFAITALTVIAAGGAQAAEWKIAGKAFSGTESVSAARHGTVPIVFHSELLGLKVTLTATGVECFACRIVGGSTQSEGQLRFTGVTVDINEVAAPKCEVSSFASLPGRILTNSLLNEVVMDPIGSGTVVFDKFAGFAGGPLFRLVFKSSGGECAVEGQEPEVTGSFCGEAVSTKAEGVWSPVLTGEEKTTQSMLFGATQQTTGFCELKLGKKVAQLTGAIDLKLSGANAGKVFGVS